MVTARTSGHAVEDLSQRDEFTRVYANPNGSWTSSTATEPESVQDTEGVWQDIDTTLVERDGALAPTYAATDVEFSDGGDQTFASMTEHGKRLDWRWPSTLPEPTIEGDTATYHDVLDGGDLVVTATATGFTHSIVLTEKPANPIDIKIPIATHGADLVKERSGAVSVETASGATLVEAPHPLMWDSSSDAQGDPGNVATVATTVGESAAGTPMLTLSPSDAFLSDPETVYPVTVDPSFTKYATGDTWIQSPDYTSSQIDSAELRVGTYDSGTHVARTFMHFDATVWNGKHVTAASLVLRNFSSNSCTAATIRAARLKAAWSTSTLTWANQPAVGTTYTADYSPAKGFDSSCAAGDAVWDIRDMVQDWASGAFVNNGLRLAAYNEANNYSWRKYRSNNFTGTGDGTVHPKINVTYNSYPNKPQPPIVWPGNPGYATTTTPNLSATVSDPDGGNVRAIFEILNGTQSVWTGTTGYKASGSAFGIPVPAGKLVNGTTYTVRVKANDGTDDSTSWSNNTTFKVDTAAPAATVTASSFTNGQWATTAPASNTFTFQGPTDVSSYSYSEDGATPKVLTPGATGATVSWNPATGSHTMTVTAVDKAGNTGTPFVFRFGVGKPGFVTPDSYARSTGTFPITVTGPPNATSAHLSWRYADSQTWNVMDDVNAGSTGWTGSVTTSNGVASSPALTWDASAQVDPVQQANIKAPALLELQTCFSYSGASDVCSNPQRVQLVPNGFGGNMPVAPVGPATVALHTGEMVLSQGDAVDAMAGVGRTFSSYNAATTTDGPFGPGWLTALIAGDSEASTAEVIDNRTQDNTFVLVSAGGGSQTFTPVSGSTTDFQPAGTDDGSRLTVDGDPGTTLTLTRPFGGTTTWTRDATTAEWTVDETVSTGADAAVTDYTPPTGANSTAWLAQVSPGTAADCTLTAQTAGCRGVKVTYTNGHVTKIEQVAYDPNPDSNGRPQNTAEGTMSTVTIAEYTYDGAGLLTKVCDPRVAAGYCTSYTYTTAGGRTLLATVTPAAQTAWRFAYDSTGRLATVKRALDPATGSGDAQWTVVYDVDPASSGLPNLTASAAAEWGQSVVPSVAAAVFPPSHVPASTPTSTDWAYASLFYETADGATTNTAEYGAGQWLVDTSWFDDRGNVTQSLDGAGYARVMAANSADRPTVAAAASSFTVFNPAGTRVEDEYGPVHTATLKDGTVGPFRPHTSYAYDDEVDASLVPGRPTLPAGQASWDLVVETRHSAADADMSVDHDTTLMRDEYAPVVSGDGDGWDFGSPTREKVQLEDGSWSTSISRLDANGNEVETRQPGGSAAADGSGNDAHSTSTVYYTADNSASDSECRGKKSWAGLVCRVGPAAQPATGPTMPVTYTVAYNRNLQPTRVEERSSGTVRSAVNAYDWAGRPISQLASITGGDASDPSRPATTYTYAGNGQVATQVNGSQTITTTHDTWGRTKTYTDASGMVSTSTYTADGQVATFNDGAGTYTYTYGGNDHRGLPTSVDIGLTSGPDVFTYDYNAAGQPTTITYPNGLSATRGYDDLGVPVTLSYTQGSTDILDFTATVDADGRTVANSSTASSQDYDYDNLGRLTKVKDTRSDGCTTRAYAFDGSSNRSSLTTYSPDTANQTCQQSTAATTWTGNYDSAGRINNGGYAYDGLGRTRTTPAADTAVGGVSALTNTYYPNDMIGSMTQDVTDGTTTTTRAATYGLDPAGRIDTVTNTTAGTETNRIRYQFSGAPDSPSVVGVSTDRGASYIPTRYISLPMIGMAGMITGAATLQLANLHGDLVAAMSDTTGNSTLDTYAESTEFGVPSSAGTSMGRYGWLGAAQRSTDAVGGMSLMGARVYSPRTGMFQSKDSVRGGGATAFAYPTSPIDEFDTTGLWWWGSVGYYSTSRWHLYDYVRIWLNRSGTMFVNDVSGALAAGSALLAAIFGAITWAAPNEYTAAAAWIFALISGEAWLLQVYAGTALEHGTCIGYRLFHKKHFWAPGPTVWGYPYYSDYACTR